MPQTTSFFVKASIAGLLVVAILAVGMAFTIRRFEQLSAAQVAHVHVEEAEVNTAARLRWSSELMVSIGRGYLLSGNGALRARLHEAASSFDGDLAELRTGALTSEVTQFVADVEHAAGRFRRVQKELVADRRQSNLETIGARFENELLPLYGEVERTVNRLLVHKEARLKAVYERAEAERNNVARRLYGLLAVLASVGLAITWFSAARLHRSHRAEEKALTKAQKALAARDELLGVVAHDLRNPLGAITAKAALLRRTGPSAEARHKGSSIENIALRMDYLIKGLLDIAAMDAGQFSITPEPSDVDGLVRDALEMFEEVAASKGVGLERGSPDIGLTVQADRERVLQVLSNLLSNALKFTPPMGRVRLDVERHDDEEMVRISISDTGSGVSKESAGRVFERFWRDDAGGPSGTGLGLFIAKTIVEAHGGRIWLESQLGHGATFHFTLPVVAGASAAPRPPATAEAPAASA
jgi:signal transduction histidine kinase